MRLRLRQLALRLPRAPPSLARVRGLGGITHVWLTGFNVGVGGGSFASVAASNAVKSTVDLDTVAGGKIALSKPDAEILIVRLQVDGYLAESFVSTACAQTPLSAFH